MLLSMSCIPTLVHKPVVTLRNLTSRLVPSQGSSGSPVSALLQRLFSNTQEFSVSNSFTFELFTAVDR
jgi:hypothetical protein